MGVNIVVFVHNREFITSMFYLFVLGDGIYSTSSKYLALTFIAKKKNGIQ